MQYDMTRDLMTRKTVLQSEQAQQIYLLKIILSGPSSRVLSDLAEEIHRLKDFFDLFENRTSSRGTSVLISSAFGVSPKTVRDIWNRRSWSRSTCKYWAFEGQSKGNHATSTSAESFSEVIRDRNLHLCTDKYLAA